MFFFFTKASVGEDQADVGLDFRVRIDLTEPSDALAALQFDEQKSRAQARSEKHDGVGPESKQSH